MPRGLRHPAVSVRPKRAVVEESIQFDPVDAPEPYSESEGDEERDDEREDEPE